MRLSISVFCILIFSAGANAFMQVPLIFAATKTETCLGTAYYVANSGNDDDPGTKAEPWETVSKVNNKKSLKPGDCIFFKRGDTWNDQLIIPSSGDASGVVTYGDYGKGDRPLFDGEGSSYSESYGGFVKAVKKSYITIKNLEVKNVAVDAGNNNAGISLYNVAHGKVVGCKVSHTDGAGIKANVGSDITFDSNEVEYACKNSVEESMSVRGIAGGYIYNNHIHHDWRGDIDGGLGIDVKAGCTDIIVEANVLHHLNPNALYVDAGQTAGMDTSNIRFTRNLVYDTYGPAMMVASEGVGNLSNVTIDNNILVGADRGGIVFHDKSSSDKSGTVSGVKIYNNTLYLNGSNRNTGWGGVRIFDPLLQDAEFKNNIFASGVLFQLGYKADKLPAKVLDINANVIDGVQTSSGGYTPIVGTGAINAAARFVNPGNTKAADFSLQAGSPAIDACDSSVWKGTPNIKDFKGTPITDGSGRIVTPGSTVNCGAIQ